MTRGEAMPSRGRAGHGAAPAPESKNIGVGAGWAAQQKGASEENREYLQAVEKRDTEMEEIELARVGHGVNQLKQIAVDMNERIQVQNAQLNPLSEQLQQHRSDLDQVHHRLRRAAKKGKRWGSFGRNLACMLILVGQLFALGFTLEFVIRERRAAHRHRGGQQIDGMGGEV